MAETHWIMPTSLNKAYDQMPEQTSKIQINQAYLQKVAEGKPSWESANLSLTSCQPVDGELNAELNALWMPNCRLLKTEGSRHFYKCKQYQSKCIQYCLKLVMSDQQPDPEGFRSRELSIKRRIQQRNKIFAEFQNARHSKNNSEPDPGHKPPQHQKDNPSNEQKERNTSNQSSRQKQEEGKEAQGLSKYVGLSQTLVVRQKEESEGEEIDMFADQIVVKQGAQVKVSQSTDEQGYYQVVSGRLLANRYRVVDKIGRGVFGIVAKAADEHSQNREVALKILRKNQTTMLSGEREFKVLSLLRKCEHVVGVYDYFHEEGHLFLVCQLMGPDLRSYTRKNQDRIALEHIKHYAISMFLSLHHLRKHRIIHADIKPDNFLFTLDLHSIKLADFGTAFSIDEHSTDIQYLVARYYRAPEVILGCEMPPEQRHGIDTWAVGCCLYQIFTGQFLFQGSSNNQMLKLIMQSRGKFSIKMLKKCKHYQQYFDSDFNFLYTYYDTHTKLNAVNKIQVAITQERELQGLLKRYSRFDEDPKLLHAFRDFLEGCLALNPKNRLTPETALQHPFLNYQVKLT